MDNRKPVQSEQDLQDRRPAAVRAVRFFSRVMSAFPPVVSLALGSAAGSLAFYFSRRRRIAYADLKAALGPGVTEKQRRAILQAHYRHIGQMAVEILRIPVLTRETLNRQVQVTEASWQRYESLLQEGRGVLLLTGHFGNWELTQIVSGMRGKPLHVLARTQKHNALNELLNEFREKHGAVAVQRGMGIRGLLRALRDGNPVGVLGDQDAGKQEGVILPLFGRKTTMPTGVFQLSQRTGAPVFPVLIARERGGKHRIFTEDPIRVSGDGGQDAVTAAARHYIGLLEKYIRLYPSQWLWETKRWKYTWTKRIAILSDGKPGHYKQCEALAAVFPEMTHQYGRKGLEFPQETVTVRFRSKFREILFQCLGIFIEPWIQGRLSRLKFFFHPETQQRIEALSADFILSAGASLVPLNRCLARENCAKSIILMRPGFPYSLLHYDLAVVPRHDRGGIPGRSFRPQLIPSRTAPELLQEAAEKLKPSLRHPGRVKISVFLGGVTRNYQMDLAAVERFFSVLGRMAPAMGDFVVTTSRRTPEPVCRFVRERVARDPHCQMAVIGAEDGRKEVAPGMLALGGILMITEDSLSMISEAVSTGKKVLILKLGSGQLPAKHGRFAEGLVREKALVIAAPENLEDKIRELSAVRSDSFLRREKENLRAIVEAIL